ncbi:glycylpeptide N-tetradecanoyltransferase [Lithohypha guttulata]|uniref:Glycylpeptide N-tetradecanoyltransferase n=1 Tax=Lithohypha guttulata TaxID=1690604 RepID=A0AAN7T7K5_9EURO|nr:glycylpeptide N-tetradecanoyltransferase [Lithohypha guttulata]
MAESQQTAGSALQTVVDSDSEAEDTINTPEDSPEASTDAPAKKKKKKSKKSKVAAALGMDKGKITEEKVDTILDNNPALKSEVAGMTPEQKQQIVKNANLEELLTGMSLSANQKDMASHKFWSTQPVPRLGEAKADREKQADGPIKDVTPEQVPKTAAPLPEGYEWVELDLLDDKELQETFELLNNHYVEDDKAMFRFSYSKTFLDWALKAPGWRKVWHVGVRAQGKSRLLVASIFGIPTKLRVRDKLVDVVEINYLCIHKKLRSKRLAPVLIKEITRRCNLEGIYQAIYTGGTVLPTPVSTCRYFHRPLQWLKLYEVGFSPLPPKTTPARMVQRNKVPEKVSTAGWREMQEKDVDGVMQLLSKYLKRFQLVQDFTREEVEHWFLNRQQDPEERVIWTFVVESKDNGSITDFASFYNLESTIIGGVKHNKIKAAYSYYYATSTGLDSGEAGLKERVTSLMSDCLVEAKKAGFDVFNALTLLDNPLCLEDLKFGAGDGFLHYYLYNWRTAQIAGGIDQKMLASADFRGGTGMVML